MADDPRAAPKPETIELNGETLPALADGMYDAIILGTGLKECILSGLLAVKGMRVLHLDRNSYYGGESASLNLTNLYKKFVRDEDPPAEFFGLLGENRNYNVDLIPKFIMAGGKLVKILVHTNVTRYLDFKQVDGSFVFKASGSSVHKVPATEMEALSTSLMGFFQKRKFRNFLSFLAKYDLNKPATTEGMDLRRVPMRAVYEKFGLDENSQDFAGHAMALRFDEGYLDRPAMETVEAIKLYATSLERYGKSPYLYPVYGLGGLPESFSRLCAINSGTFMLNAGDPQVVFEGGVAVGVTVVHEGVKQAARAPMVIGDPTYFAPEKSRRVGQVIRTICILDHPVAAVGGVDSAQIILPQKQVGRKNDIYVTIVSSAHMVAHPGRYVAIVSTTVETADPRSEVAPGVRLLGSVLQRFDNIGDLVVPVGDGMDDRCFITSSYDASSHFETTATDVLNLYERVTGEALPLDISTDLSGE